MKKEIFKRVEFDFSNNWGKSFKQLELVPQITLFFDTQMENGFETEDSIIYGTKSLSIGISWLIWFAMVEVSFKTNKWEDDCDATLLDGLEPYDENNKHEYQS